MKITGTRSYILVEFDHRTVKIKGELTTTPKFYADIKSIKNWEPPFDGFAISEDEKNQIIEAVLKENATNKTQIVFE